MCKTIHDHKLAKGEQIMALLTDIDGKTIPVISRKVREPMPHLHNWKRYQELGIKQGTAIWVTMTTTKQLAGACMTLYDLMHTADGW